MKSLPEEYRQEIIKHYAMFLQYYYAEGSLSQLALAHYIFLDCTVYPQKIIVDIEDKVDKKKLIKFLEGIAPKDVNLKMTWEFSLQNMAKAKGEFKRRLEIALQSKELRNMPAPIKEINEYHIKELLGMYRLWLLCPNCSFEIMYLGGIALIKGGDEQILNYMQCENCSKYFISEYKEGFREEEDVEDKSIYEIKPEQAASDLKEIKTCPEPYNKHCKCKAHLDYFGT